VIKTTARAMQAKVTCLIFIAVQYKPKSQ
jgi:hypothetical protein